MLLIRADKLCAQAEGAPQTTVQGGDAVPLSAGGVVVHDRFGQNSIKEGGGVNKNALPQTGRLVNVGKGGTVGTNMGQKCRGG
jgi:hypothetical protein